MTTIRLIAIMTCLSLTLSFAPGTTAHAQTAAPAAASSSSSTTQAKMRAVAQKSVSTNKVKRQVATAKAAVSTYRKLLPKGHKLYPAKARAFAFSGGRVLVAIPILNKAYPGGAFSFVFAKKKLISSQQVILQASRSSATMRVYTNGKLTKKVSSGAVLLKAPTQARAFQGMGDPFTDCWNSMPSWVIDAISFLCTVSCIGAEVPPSLLVCIACIVGLGGMYASFALECADGKHDQL